MGKLSKRKGSGFERQIAKALSDWSGVHLVRTPMSGGWAGSIADVWPRDTSVYFPMVIECKKVEGWTLDQVFLGKGPLIDWLDQAIDQARSISSEKGLPYEEVLIVSGNRRPIYVVMKVHLLSDTYHKPVIMFTYRGNDYCLLLLGDYLGCTTLEEFKRLVK